MSITTMVTMDHRRRTQTSGVVLGQARGVVVAVTTMAGDLMAVVTGVEMAAAVTKAAAQSAHGVAP
jgi:hypothetical protein